MKEESTPNVLLTGRKKEAWSENFEGKSCLLCSSEPTFSPLPHHPVPPFHFLFFPLVTWIQAMRWIFMICSREFFYEWFYYFSVIKVNLLGGKFLRW